MGLNQLPANQLGAGHPPGVIPRVEQRRQGSFLHGKALPADLHRRKKVLRHFRRFQHPAHAHARAALCGGLPQTLQHLRMHGIVAVHEADPFSPGNGKGAVSRRGLSLVFLMDDPHPAVPRRVIVADDAAAVRAAVVHQDQLKIGNRLGKNTVDAGMQVRFRLINRHDHADFRHLSSSPIAPAFPATAGKALP